VLSYDLWNSSVFNALLKVCSDGNDVIAGGSMFQTLAVVTGRHSLFKTVFTEQPPTQQQHTPHRLMEPTASKLSDSSHLSERLWTKMPHGKHQYCQHAGEIMLQIVALVHLIRLQSTSAASQVTWICIVLYHDTSLKRSFHCA